VIKKSAPMLGGRVLSAVELRRIRKEIESFDSIEVVTDEMRALVESEWPDLVNKLPPKPQVSKP
jgi:hypothetical protein